MSHPRKVWIVFAAALVVVVAAMGYLSAVAVRLDDDRIATKRQAELEESVRLSLWRMDGALTALVSQESTRPVFEYRSFYTPNNAFSATYVQFTPGSVVMPSPLLWQDPPLVLLHFSIAPDGALSSPQVMPDVTKNPVTADQVSTGRAGRTAERLKKLKAILARGDLASSLPEPPAAPAPCVVNNGTLMVFDNSSQQNDVSQRQVSLNGNEFNARNFSSFIAQGQNTLYSNNRDVAAARTLRDGQAKGVWLGDDLVLARRVVQGDQTRIVGCWLDWPAMRPWLLGYVQDLLPEAQLVAAGSNGQEDYDRRLASLPLRLVPGSATVSPDDRGTLAASLGAAWAGVMLAALAIAAMLHGVLSLSQRRAVFATAVTHELRTPLTSMRMYTEMLADGQVADADRQAKYLNTLHAQTGRLCHLVENVLEYAQLEAGRADAVAETDVTASELIDRAEARLAQRAEQAGMEVVFEIAPDAAERKAHVDPLAVEQILFNLVDNACKYAADAADRRIHFAARRAGRMVEFSICDHGRGISDADTSRIFRPFYKARGDEAGTSGGVGLGLAISRRAAKRMGGRLTCRPSGDRGACFVLTLPTAR